MEMGTTIVKTSFGNSFYCTLPCSKTSANKYNLLIHCIPKAIKSATKILKIGVQMFKPKTDLARPGILHVHGIFNLEFYQIW